MSVVAALASLGTASSALATTRTWAGGAGANWSAGASWGGTAPQAGDDVVFDTTTTSCTVDVDTARIASLTISSNYTGTITPSAGKTLVVTGNYSQSRGTMNAAASTFIGGTFTLNGANAATFNAGSGTVVIQGAYTQSTATTTFNANTAYIVFGNTMTKSAGTFTPNTSTIMLAGLADANVPLGSFSTLWIEDPAESHLVAHWKLDEATGISVWDWSGNGYNGTIASGDGTLPTWKTTGLPSSGLGTGFKNRSGLTFVYTGTDHNQQISFPISTNYNPITVSAWINIPTADDGQGNPRIVDLPHFRVYITSGSKIGVYSDRLGAACYGGSGTGDGNWQPSTTFSRDAWHHVAVTYTAESSCPCNNLPKVYLDGSLIASVAGDFSLNTAPTVTTLCSPVTGFLGNSNPSSDNINGSIDDVRIYDTELSLTQVQALNAGGYANGASTRTFTLTAATTVSSLLSLYRGTLLTGSNNLTASDATQAALFDWGALTVGNATARFDGGLTFNGNATLTMNTTGGTVSIGSGKTLAMNGTLDASTASVTPTIKSVSGNYAFSVGSTATATPTLNIDGLAVQNTDVNGMYINATGASGPVTTITRLDNVAFSSGSTTSGATLLNIYATSLYLTGNGCTFNRNGMNGTSYNVKITGDNSSANGETRATFGNATCTSNTNASETCEGADNDNDSTADGVPDSTGGGVVQFIQEAYTESTGTVQGFPTPAFTWSTFNYWRTYTAFNNETGTIHTLYARNDASPGSAYSWAIPSGKGSFVGAPRWDAECASSCSVEANWTHYVYVITSTGAVYKLLDDGSVLSVVANWPYRNGDASNDGTGSATATSPLVMDTTNIYWAGHDSGGAEKLFSLIRASRTLNGTPATPSADVSGAPAFAGTSIYFATKKISTNSKVYQWPVDFTGTEKSFSSTTSGIADRLSIFNSKIYFAEDVGKVWAITTASPPVLSWSYQDTTSSGHTCSESSNCTVKSLFLNPRTARVYYGDQDGHVYVVAFSSGTSGAPINGNYPLRPSGALTSTPFDPIVVAPVYVTGLSVGSNTNAAIIAVGSSSGKVWFIDQSTPGTIIKMYHFGSAISNIAYEYQTASTGRFLISTAAGRTYYIDAADVPDNTPTVN